MEHTEQFEPLVHLYIPFNWRMGHYKRPEQLEQMVDGYTPWTKDSKRNW